MTKAARMTLTETAAPAGADIRMIPLQDLYIHPFNPRHEPPDAEIAALADSIAASGLLQNLLGFADQQIRFRDGQDHRDPDTIGIVAGGRRLRALQLLATRGQWPHPVPVRLTDDINLAREWAGTENETHAPLPIADRIVAYRQMQATGATHDAIAAAFATPLSDVRRLLALADLPEPVIDALRDGKITFNMAKTLTAAQDQEQQLQLLDAVLKGNLQDWELRGRLDRTRVSGNTVAALYVGLDAYHAAGGTSTLDLFEDRTWLHDGALMTRLATEKAEAELEAIRAAEGWSWARYAPDGDLHTLRHSLDLKHVPGTTVDLPDGDAARLEHLAELEDRTEAEEAELEALERRAEARIWPDADLETCGILAKIGHHGALTIERAWRLPTESAGETAADDDGAITITPATPEASMPQNLKDDLRRIRLICIQDALLRDECLLHDLLALQFTGRLSQWERPFDLTQQAAIPPEKPDGLTIPKRLLNQDTGDRDDATHALVTDWMATDHATIDREFYAGLARSFVRTDGPFVDALHARTPINPRDLWQPTAAGYLNRISAGALDAIWRELVPEDTGSARDGFFGMTKKEKARQLERLFEGHDLREAMGLSRETNAAIDAWTPDALRFTPPATAEDGGADA